MNNIIIDIEAMDSESNHEKELFDEYQEPIYELGILLVHMMSNI